MGEPLDRRTFLAGLAAAALSLEACGGGSGSPPAGPRAAPALRRGLAPPNRRRSVAPVPSTLEAAVRGPVLRPGRPGFREAARVYNERFDAILPVAVAQPLDESDAQAALRWVLARERPFRIRSGGHSYAGYSTLQDGIVIDLRRLRSIQVAGSGIASVGAGAQMIDVYAALAARGAALPAGSCPSVGVSGVTLGGGMGLAGRAWGLTSDHLQAARIVTADGRLRTVDARHDRALLWALRGGGGGNFGMVTRFSFRVRRLPRAAVHFSLTWPWSSAAEAVAAWLGWAPHTDERLTAILRVASAGSVPSIGTSGQFLGREDELIGLLGPLLAVPGAARYAGTEGWMALQLRWAGCDHGLAACHTAGRSPGGVLPREGFLARSDYLERPLAPAGVAQLLSSIEARAREPGSGAVLFDAYGGAINRVAPGASAFVHRNALCCLQYLSYGGGGRWMSRIHAAMRPFVSGKAYQNYIDPQLEDWRQAYYGQNYRRLLEIRREVDPEHRFRFPQAIGV